MKNIQLIATIVSNYNRKRKYNFFLNQFNPTKTTKILDVGASEKEYQDTANILEKKYPWPENITVLGTDEYKKFIENYPNVPTITYNGGVFPFEDNRFDICWCNAVIEHVGDKKEQGKFLKEIERVSKTAFITTPNRYFPFEVHTKILFLHYLPKRIFEKILRVIGKSWSTGNYMNLFSLKELKQLLDNCNIKNYRIVKNKFLGFTIDFAIIF